jgi:hypothetical protein
MVKRRKKNTRKNRSSKGFQSLAGGQANYLILQQANYLILQKIYDKNTAF